MRSMTRRNLIRGAGGALLALPLLHSLGGRGARAGGPPPGAMTKDGYPKRLLIFFKGNGVYPDTWWPTAEGPEGALSLAAATAPLEPFRDHLLFLDGVDLRVILDQRTPGEAHQQGAGSLLTGWELNQGDILGADGSSRAGWGKGPSLDQVIARYIGSDRRLLSLEVGAHTETGNLLSQVINYAGNDQPIVAKKDPAAVFQELFSDFAVPPSERLVLRDKRVSVLDFVHQRMRSVASAAGSEDRARIEQHAEFVRDVERRIVRDAGASCEVPGAPATMDPNDQRNMEAILEAQRDLILHAFACDLTRVATLMVGNGGNQLNYAFLDAHGNDHVLAHGEQSNADNAQVKRLPRHRWCMEQLRGILEGLASMPEGNGTLLDRTLVLFCSENSTGWHSQRRMPFLLAGKLDGHFRTGRALRFEGAHHNNLLVSILNAFGVETETFGNPSFCTGPLPGLLA